MNATVFKHEFALFLLLNLVVFSRLEVQCGERYSPLSMRKKPLYRIVGGKEATYGDFPWQASIQKNGRHYCGASVISTKWVITAAHCLKPISKSELSSIEILVGSNYHDNRDNKGSFHKVKETLIHESFDGKNFLNDIGLIQLSDEIEFRKGGSDGMGAVGPVCLAPANAVYVGTATVSGWGTLKWKGMFPSKLQGLDLKLLDDENCKKSTTVIYDPDRHLCAGYLEGKKDACEGDSGGPLVTLIDDYATQIGIVSYGQECALPGYPGVYTEVSFYRGWIESQTGETFA